MDGDSILRFLPWHRIYIFELEEMLQAIEPGISIPYWDWENQREIPNWLMDFTPDVPYDGGIISVVRRSASSRRSLPSQWQLPPKEDVDKILSLSKYAESNGTPSRRIVAGFTLAMEAGNRETQTNMHNAIHNWVGGTMATMLSPADILFWLHHANEDRIWASWQQDHSNEHPDLKGTDAIMNPWTDHNEEETRSIQNLNYRYE